MKIKSYNEVIYFIATKAKELADLKMPALRISAGYDCVTNQDIKQATQGMTRGQLIEIILTEEYTLDQDIDLEDETDQS